MKRRDFLKLIGFTIAAAACHPRLVLGKSVPAPYECDARRLHFSDDGFYVAAFEYGTPTHYYALACSYNTGSATEIPWPDAAVPYLEA